jgi:hypothetical protein
MEAMRESWTDERLDDFRGEVGRRFDEVDKRIDQGFGKVEVELHRINDRLDTTSRAIIYGALTLSGSMVAGFVTMAALIVTQL